MAQAFLIQKSGGGGVNQTLPAQVTAFHAAANSTPSITLTWTNPTDHFGGVLIVKKIGTAPTSPTDGEKIYSGTAETFTDADVQFDTEYFYRAFAFNEKKQYQTIYSVASAKPVEGIPLSELAEGTLVNINEGGTAVPFYLAKHDYESGLNGAGRQLFVRKDCYDERLWDSSYNAYATADIDAWQNGDYKAKLSKAVQEMIGETTFYYTVGKGDSTVTTLSRSVFSLSVTEVGLEHQSANVEGSALPIATTLQKAKYNGSITNWWTRSPARTSNNRTVALIVAYNSSTRVIGISGSAVYTDPRASRPCFTLPANAVVYPEPNADGSYTLIEEVA